MSLCILVFIVFISYAQNVTFAKDTTKVLFKTSADSLITAVIEFKAEFLFNVNDTLLVSVKEVKEGSKILSNGYELPADSVYKLFLPDAKDSFKIVFTRNDNAPDTALLIIKLEFSRGKSKLERKHYIQVINDVKKDEKKETTSEDKKLVEEIKASVSEMKKLLGSYKDKTDSTYLGDFYILKPNEVDSVYIKINDGMITKIKIYKDKKRTFYENNDAPIGLNDYGKKRINCLMDNSSKGTIKLEDYIWFNAYSYFLYQNGDKEFWLNNNTSFEDRKLYIKEGIDNVINVKIFTDFAGLNGQPNGILQTEISGRFLLHSTNVRNHWMFFAREFLPSLAYSKFDSKDKDAKLDSNGRVNRLELTQKAFVDLNLKLNLFKWIIQTNSFNVNIGWNFKGTKAISVKDSTYNPVILHNGIFGEATWKHQRTNYFSFEIALPFYVSTIDGAKDLKITDNKTGILIIPQFTINYQPGKSGSLFFRFKHFDDINVSNRNFNQYQFGYSVNFTDLFSK